MIEKDRIIASAGLDIHYQFSTVALCNAQGQVVRRERLEHRDRDALRQRLEQWPKGIRVVMEASFGWGWLSDLMEEVGLNVRLSNCYKVAKMREARGLDKTNDKDACLQASLLQEVRTWWGVWRSTPLVRECREWMRHRADLVMIQTEVKNRIHAIFHRYGIFHDFSDLFGGGGRRFMAKLLADQDPQSRYLPGGARMALKGNLELLDHLRRDLAKIATVLHKSLGRTELTQWLCSVPGFGLILSHVVKAEVGDLRRFRNSRALGRCCLLAPQCDDTGEDLPPGKKPLGRHVGRRGNRTLKWAFIEAAHGAVRSGGQWRQLFDRRTDGGKRNRGHGYIAVARALVDVIYAVWRDQRPYLAQRPARPAARSARPGTGRLLCPMVVASK